MGIKLSISNIAWSAEHDLQIYECMQRIGFQGLEIAPTRIYPSSPYEKKAEAQKYSRKLKQDYGLSICSMQSIWYGHNERIFGTDEERHVLLDYTKKAIDFSEAVGAGNLVFGCPKNRNISADADRNIAISFFGELGDYAEEHGTVLSLEANPIIYGTNFINKTSEAIELVKEVGSKGFKLNLDFGTVIYNEESVDDINMYVEFVNHVHISEPNLKMIERRKEHKELVKILNANSYEGFISIEMGKRDDLKEVINTMDYISEIVRN